MSKQLQPAICICRLAVTGGFAAYTLFSGIPYRITYPVRGVEPVDATVMPKVSYRFVSVTVWLLLVMDRVLPRAKAGNQSYGAAEPGWMLSGSLSLSPSHNGFIGRCSVPRFHWPRYLVIP